MQQDSFLWRFTNLQPAVYKGVVVGLVGLLAALGVVISPDIPDQVILFTTALMAMIQALWTKESVTPNAKVLAYLDDPSRPRSITAGEATTTASDAAIIDAVRTEG